MGLSNSWRDCLCCPECLGALREDGPDFVCTQCGTRYGRSPSGIPILMRQQDLQHTQAVLAQDQASGMKADYQRRTEKNAFARFSRRFYPPEPVYVNPAAPPIPQPMGELSLWLGGAGLQLPGFVNVDLVEAPGVNLLADVNRIPFRADCCDSVACPALLEHVPDPERVVSEIHRVLKAGGEAQAVVPFCHPYHAYPADYARFSHEGLEKLFGQFRNVEIGIRTGPTTTILIFLTYYSKLLFPVHGGRPLRRAVNRLVAGAFGWCIYPFKYLDAWLNRLPQARLLANHFYVTARK